MHCANCSPLITRLFSGAETATESGKTSLGFGTLLPHSHSLLHWRLAGRIVFCTEGPSGDRRRIYYCPPFLLRGSESNHHRPKEGSSVFGEFLLLLLIWLLLWPGGILPLTLWAIELPGKLRCYDSVVLVVPPSMWSVGDNLPWVQEGVNNLKTEQRQILTSSSPQNDGSRASGELTATGGKRKIGFNLGKHSVCLSVCLMVLCR